MFCPFYLIDIIILPWSKKVKISMVLPDDFMFEAIVKSYMERLDNLTPVVLQFWSLIAVTSFL